MKLKSHSGMKKRVKITGRGKIKFKKPCKNHLLINKSKRQKRLYKPGMPLHRADERRIERLLPNAF